MKERYWQRDRKGDRLEAVWSDGEMSVRAHGPKEAVLDLMDEVHQSHGGPDPRAFKPEPIPGQMEFEG